MATNLLRNYKMSDAKLVEATNVVLVGAARDLDELAAYGQTQDDIDALRDLRAQFYDLPTDIELSSMMAEATEAKNRRRAEAIAYVMKEIMIRVEMGFGADSAEYARFGVATMHNMTDAELLLLLHNVHRLALRLQPDLVAQGLTPALVAGVAQAATDFVALLMAQADAVDDRDRAVDLRVATGNALYAKVVTLAELGKRLWFNVNPSRYNEYLIYRRNARPKAEEVETAVAPATTVTLAVRALRANTPLQIDNTGPVAITLYFCAQPTDAPSAQHPGISIAPGQSWRGTAAALGYATRKRTYLNAINPDTDSEGTVTVLVG